MSDLASLSTTTPPMPRHLWAVLLAGGDGIRLRDLTVRIVGDHRPKQFCPIIGSESLLSQTRARLDPLFSGDRQVFVVSCAHERYYSGELADAKDSLVIAQPMNRGTAIAITVALVQIMQADPDAVIGLFPCDHYYSDDESFRSIVRSAAAGAERFPRSLVIVGAEADHPETEYGWIEPGPTVLQTQANPLYRVNRFWEKPALPQARALLQSGCLWNTFVTVGSAVAFLELLCSEVPEVVLSVTRALADKELAPTYARLPNLDFSRDILAVQAKRLLVLRNSGSGWTDLGSPDRVLGLFASHLNQPAWATQPHRCSPRVPTLREILRWRQKATSVTPFSQLCCLRQRRSGGRRGIWCNRHMRVRKQGFRAKLCRRNTSGQRNVEIASNANRPFCVRFLELGPRECSAQPSISRN
jgi:mannose-1-phosphate guanylyltransferase